MNGFITERKNTHIEHLEDLVFSSGVDGTRRSIEFLRALRDMLSGRSSTRVSATVKWDGAPAIFIGIDPSDDQFFVATKGVFNKSPKIFKTHAEITAGASSPELGAKLKIALDEFKKLGVKKGVVYQGDLMFTSLDTQTIAGEKYTTFHPNTIIYAVPYESALARRLRSSKIGVVWHTAYSGSSLEAMTAASNANITSQLKPNRAVWMQDATYKDYSGTATFTKSETDSVTADLSKAGKLFSTIPASVFDGISKNPDLLTMVASFTNSKVRANQKLTNPVAHVNEMFHWIYDRYQKEIDEKKTDAGKAAVTERRKRALSYFATNDKAAIARLFELAALLADIKAPIIAKMNQASNIATFVKTTTGFKVTGIEGVVAVDHVSGTAVKLVDRLEFSTNNFSPDVIKGWQR